MSQDGALACAERMKTDQEFRDEVAAAAPGEARLAVITGAGFDVDASDKDTIVNAMTASDGELADAELDRVAGGDGACDYPSGPNPGMPPFPQFPQS